MFKLVDIVKGFYIYKYKDVFFVAMDELRLDEKGYPKYCTADEILCGVYTHYGEGVFATLEHAKEHIYEFLYDGAY